MMFCVRHSRIHQVFFSFFLSVFLYALLGSVQTQTISDSSVFVLVKGTLAIKGLPFLPANAFPAHYGEYRSSQGPIRVWYSSHDVFFSETWEKLPGRDISLLEDEISGTLAYKASDHALFFSFPVELNDRRAFILLFLSRFEPFRKSARGSAELSFPAILEPR